MTCRNFNGSEFPLNRLYMLLARVLPENEHEELRGEMREFYRQLIKKRHSRTDAMLRTSWQAIMFVTGMCLDNTVGKTGSFKEEALRLKDLFSKLYKILCLMIFPVLYLTQDSITLFIFLIFISIGCLWMSFEWTFNHKSALRFCGVVVALLTISPLLVFTLVPQQRQIFDLYMSDVGFPDAPWPTGLTVLALVTFLLLLSYLTVWIICGVTAYLVTGAWYLRSIFFK